MAWKKKELTMAPSMSAETTTLIQEALLKRGLSARAMQDARDSLRRGDNDWVERLSTASAAGPSSPACAVRLKAKGIAVRVPKCVAGEAPRLPPARFSGIKLQHEIKRDSPSVREQYVGAPVVDREAEKDRLRRVFEYGAAGAKEMESRARGGGAHTALGSRHDRLTANGLERQVAVDPKEALIDQIIEEVKERREFLQEMRAAGRAGPYEATLRADITLRLAELRDLGMAVRP